jgi:hypothetical protein
MNQNEQVSGLKTYAGSCHCGAVKFEATMDLGQGAAKCNCTVCTKVAQLGIIVKPEALRVLEGESELSTYEWGAKIGKRFFCKHCGIHCFGRGYLEQVGGAYASINLNTIDGLDPSLVKTGYFDGRHNNWMAGIRSTPWPIA